MTLFKQIAILFSVILLFILALVLSISFLDTKRFVENELYQRAQNNAAVLSVNLSTAKGDMAKIYTIVNAVFDNGHYKAVLLHDMKGKILLKKVSKKNAHVPPWFGEFIDLSQNSAQAQVSSGWQPFGVLSVTIDKSKAIEYLYHLFKNIVLVFFIAGLVGVWLIYILLKVIFKPLQRVRHQAQEVIKNRFEYQKFIPQTLELRTIVIAMNKIVGKMEKIYHSLQSATAKNQKITYTDEITSLGNRRFFILKYNEYVKSLDNRAGGVVLFLRIANTLEANKIIGFDKVNEIYKNIALVLKENTLEEDDAIACRVSGTEFGCLLPAVTKDETDRIAQNISVKITSFLDRYPALNNVMKFYMVAKTYEKNLDLSTMFSSIDFNLNTLESEGKERYKCIVKENFSIKKSECRAILQQALHHHRFEIIKQPIIALQERKKIDFINFFINDERFKQMDFKSIIPLVKFHGLYGSYMRQVWNLLETMKFEHDISVEVDISCFEDFDTMITSINSIKKQGIDVIVEIPQNCLQKMSDFKLKSILKNLKDNSVDIAISRFDADENITKELYDISPKYVKMYAGHFLEMNDALKESFILMLKAADVKIVLDKVEEDKKKLEKYDIDYFVL